MEWQGGLSSVLLTDFIIYIKYNTMYGLAIGTLFIILSVYIFMNKLLDLGSSKGSDSSSSYSYHLGCFENNSPLNQSKQIQRYLVNLSSSLSSFSPDAVRQWQQYNDQRLVNPDGANSIALEFKNYIVAYENMKSLNQYQQTYNKGIREARDDFLQCREKFQENQWDCKGTYDRYLKSDEEFNIIKGNLSSLISRKYEEQEKIEKLLDPPSHSQDTDNETYYKLMEQLNTQLSQLWEAIKQKNQSLIGIENKEYKQSHDLVHMRQLLEECTKNKKEIEICKNIGERLQDIFRVVDPHDLKRRIEAKQHIIERYENALAKSMKVGLDTTEIRQKLLKNQKQLSDLLDMYNEVETARMCAGDLVKKCSDQQIDQLSLNITKVEKELATIRELKIVIIDSINDAKKRIDEINEQKRLATEEYQNTLGSIEKIKELQAQNLQKLKKFRDNIHIYNGKIIDMQKDIDSAEVNRKKSIHDLDGILKRVGQLTGCLAKKDYLLKLQSKRPQTSEEDVKLKRKAAENLIKVIESMSRQV